MTLVEINSKYSEKDLCSIPGDENLRRELYLPFLQDLYQNKIVYYERFCCVAIVENLVITPEYFEVTAVPFIKIERAGSMFPYYPAKPWTFGVRWDTMRLIRDHFAGYGSWAIWTEKDLVKTVEELARKREFETALELTVYKGQ